MRPMCGETTSAGGWQYFWMIRAMRADAHNRRANQEDDDGRLLEV